MLWVCKRQLFPNKKTQPATELVEVFLLFKPNKYVLFFSKRISKQWHQHGIFFVEPKQVSKRFPGVFFPHNATGGFPGFPFLPER